MQVTNLFISLKLSFLTSKMGGNNPCHRELGALNEVSHQALGRYPGSGHLVSAVRVGRAESEANQQLASGLET